MIRAEEWLSSLPKHVQLYRSFGWEMPVFCHLPLLRNADKSKISKRKNPVSLNHYRRAGFFPEALVNYLALMGGRHAERPGGVHARRVRRRLLPRAHLAGRARLRSAEAGLAQRQVPAEDVPARAARRACAEYLLSDDYMLRVLPLVQERIDTLEGFFDYGHFFFAGEVAYDAEAMKQLVPKGRTPAETAKALLALLEERVDPLLDWDARDDRGRAARLCGGLGLERQGRVHGRARRRHRTRRHAAPVRDAGRPGQGDRAPPPASRDRVLKARGPRPEATTKG